MRRGARLAAILGLAAACALRTAGAAGAAGAVPVDNGLHYLTLDGHAMLALRAWRENYNAHGFDVVSFYVVRQEKGKDALDLVPLFGAGDGHDQERYQLTVSGGADCVLQDFRLVPGAGARATRLVIARRDVGASYANPGTVHFTYYALTRNADGLPGRPPLFFQRAEETASQQPYCDVNEAFDRELHLGTSSTGNP